MRTLTIVSLALLLAACAPLRAPETAERWWPLPPDQPRIQYVQRIDGSRYIQRQKKNFLLRERLGVNLRTIDFVKPYDVAVASNGRVFVSDTGRTGVVWLDEANANFGVLGGQGDFGVAKALGLDLDNADNLYVVDSLSHRIVVYDSAGKGQRAFGSADLLDRPSGIAVDQAHNRIYVSDSKSHDIEVFDMAGEHVTTLGERGSGDGQFNFPTHLDVANDGTLYVADSMNFRIQRWDAQGNFVDSFGSVGNTPGTFFRLKGIAVDSDGRVWAADASFGVVQVFDKDLNLLLVFANFGQGQGDLNLASGVDMSTEGDLYVASQLSRTVEVYHLLVGDEIDAAAARREAVLSGEADVQAFEESSEAPEAAPEATPEATPEAQPEATPESGPEPSPEADQPDSSSDADEPSEAGAPLAPSSSDFNRIRRRNGRPMTDPSFSMPAKR